MKRRILRHPGHRVSRHWEGKAPAEPRSNSTRFLTKSQRELRPPGLSVHQRDGLTLLEVVLTLAIFVGAMAVLSQLISTGHRAALDSRMQTQAVIRAEAQMNEVIADPSLMVSTSGMSFTEEYNPAALGQWNWSLDVQSWDQNTNLLQLELTVAHLTTGGKQNANYTLRRYVRDPQALLDSIAETEAEVE